MSVQCEELRGELRIQLPKRIGKGTVSVYEFHDGLSLFTVDCYLKREVQLKFVQQSYHPLRFICCQEGMLTHTVDSRNVQYQLKALECSLSACSGSSRQFFRFDAKIGISVVSLEINRQEYFHQIRDDLKTLPPQLEKVFSDVKAKEPFLYHSYYSIAVADIVNQIRTNQYQGFIRKIFLESKALELLSLMIAQYKEDQIDSSPKIIIRKADEEKLIQAREIILNRLKNPPSIKELSKLVGINEYKLKKGYKQLFHTTIYGHIREERLHQARLLLMEGKLDVGEIADRMGYINKSHFAARFKEKFGMLPKQFQQSSLD